VVEEKGSISRIKLEIKETGVKEKLREPSRINKRGLISSEVDVPKGYPARL
jgi:hypothetical protein